MQYHNITWAHLSKSQSQIRKLTKRLARWPWFFKPVFQTLQSRKTSRTFDITHDLTSFLIIPPITDGRAMMHGNAKSTDCTRSAMHADSAQTLNVTRYANVALLPWMCPASAHQEMCIFDCGNLPRPQSKQLGSEPVRNHSNQRSFSVLFWLISPAFPMSDYVARSCCSARDYRHWPTKWHLETCQIAKFYINIIIIIIRRGI